MPKDPPYYARITFRVTVTQFLRSAENCQADYDYAIGQQSMRHYDTFRIHNPASLGDIHALLACAEEMIRSHLGDMFPQAPLTGGDTWLSSVLDDQKPRTGHIQR